MSQETELIKERLDIAEVVREYVQLKQAGRSFKGLCPFHQEKTPSFIVSPDKGIWWCFGCQKGGDVFSFIQQIEGVEFPEALKTLAERAGVPLPSRSAAAAPGEQSRRSRLFDLMNYAARFYHEILMRQQAGEKAKGYLKERGVREETMELFQAGYAVNSWDGIQIFLRRKGYLADEMIASGLVGRSERGKLYDRFRGRVMFPIHDVQGRVVGFGGRIVPWHATGEEGKYVNSPETEIYSKRRTVYNLNRAKINLRQHQPCLVVEGYMDVAMLVQEGVGNVVASSGTAFTAEQIKLLQRYTDTLHFAFDADNAGVHAAQSATQAAVAAGMRVATVLFPSGKDPADVALEMPEKLPQFLSQPTPLIQVLLQRLKEAGSPGERESLVREVLPFIAQVSNVVQQGEMIQGIAATLHVPESVIMAQLAKVAFTPAAAVSGLEGVGGERLSAEQFLLGMLIISPAARAEVWPQLNAELFTDSVLRDVYERLEAGRDQFMDLPADQAVARAGADLMPFLEAIRQAVEEERSHSGSPEGEEARRLLRLLQKKRLQRRMKELQEQMAQMKVRDNGEALREFKDVAEKLARLAAEQ